jgi:hypothetical protein
MQNIVLMCEQNKTFVFNEVPISFILILHNLLFILIFNSGYITHSWCSEALPTYIVTATFKCISEVSDLRISGEPTPFLSEVRKQPLPADLSPRCKVQRQCPRKEQGVTSR